MIRFFGNVMMLAGMVIFSIIIPMTVIHYVLNPPWLFLAGLAAYIIFIALTGHAK